MAYIGIYKIRNTKNGNFYLGSSDNIHRRFSRHKLDLSKNRHDNPHLQNAWNKYGNKNFEFEIVKMCDKAELLLEEQKELDLCVGNPECYNIRENAVCPVSPGSKRPEWVINKISMSQKGKPRWTEEQRKQMSIDRKGRKHKPETILKFLNRQSSYENIKKAQISNIGRHYSEEHKSNISIGKILANRVNTKTK